MTFCAIFKLMLLYVMDKQDIFTIIKEKMTGIMFDLEGHPDETIVKIGSILADFACKIESVERELGS